MKLTVFVSPKNRPLLNDISSLEYIHSFYTPEEITKFKSDFDECVRRGWIKSYEEGSRPHIDIPANSFVAEYIGDNVQAFIDYFVVERGNFNPVKDYFDDHPEQGSTGAIVS